MDLFVLQISEASSSINPFEIERHGTAFATLARFICLYIYICWFSVYRDIYPALNCQMQPHVVENDPDKGEIRPG